MTRTTFGPRVGGRPRRLRTAVALLLGGCAPALVAGGPRDTQPAARPASPRSVDFVCDGGPRLSVAFDGKTARLVDPAGREVTLDQRPAASGFHYEAAGESLRGKGQELEWSRSGAAPLTCRSSSAGPAVATPGPPEVPGLSGTHWQLVQFQSSDDAVGTIKPDDPTRFTMELSADGRAALRLDCNRTTGRWSAAATSPTGGSFALGPLAGTRAACPDGMSSRVAADSPRVRSYTLAGDTLNLALVADGGVYTWRRVEK